MNYPVYLFISKTFIKDLGLDKLVDKNSKQLNYLTFNSIFELFNYYSSGGFSINSLILGYSLVKLISFEKYENISVVNANIELERYNKLINIK